jgi:hypothetical protein
MPDKATGARLRSVLLSSAAERDKFYDKINFADLNHTSLRRFNVTKKIIAAVFHDVFLFAVLLNQYFQIRCANINAIDTLRLSAATGYRVRTFCFIKTGMGFSGDSCSANGTVIYR